MVLVEITFSYDWLKTQVASDHVPVEYAENLFKRVFDGKFTLTNTSVMSIEFKVDEDDANKVKRIVDNEIIKDEYFDDYAVEKIDVKPIPDEDVLPTNTPDSAFGKFFADEKKDEDESEVKKTKENAVEKLSKEINGLVGAGEFKALANQIIAVAPQIVSHKTQRSFAFQSYLFSINDGCGICEKLELLAKLLNELKVYTNKNRIFTKTIETPGRGGLESVLGNAIDNISDVPSTSVIVLDLRNVMNNLADPDFKNFLFKLRKYEEDYIIVFQVPFIEPYALKNVEREIADVMYIKTVTFAPYSNEELKEIAVRAFAEYGYTCDEEGLEIVFKRINEEKNFGRFYGDDTVRKVVDEAIFTKQLANVAAGKDDTLIVKEDVKSLCDEFESGEKSSEELLDELIGLETVKNTLNDIISQVKFAKNSKDLKTPCIHMRFTGNPGTGKTTVARILGLMMKENGILRNGYFFECMARDLCGQYIGETAPKTQNKCRDAYGSILFIDEAYALYAGGDDRKDYGREALTALIAEMENHRDDLVVIMAGYSDDMKTLMDGNAGLRSRMPYEIHFPNYTRDELAAIFMVMAKKNFSVEDGLEEKVKEYFNSLPADFVESNEFSNARFVRNLYERTWSKSASRSRFENSESVGIKIEDFVAATAESEFSDFNTQKKATLGF